MSKEATQVSERPIPEIVDHILEAGPSVSSMIWGQPGLGKTETIKSVFGNEGFEVIPVLAGCSEPTDFSGIPFPYEFEGRNVAVQNLAPLWAFRCSTEAPTKDQGPKVLFFDDIVTATEQTQAACFKVIGEHRLGDLTIRDNVYIIAAGNRVEDKSAVVDMPMALANRFKHYYAKVDIDAWIAWALAHNIHPNIIAYLRRSPQHLSEFETIINKNAAQKAFATPRSWEGLSKSMWILEKAKITSKRRTFLEASSWIGSGIGTSFAAFVNTAAGLIPPQDIIKDPKNTKIPTTAEIDILHATISALEYYMKQGDNIKKWEKAATYILRDEMEPEFGILIAKGLINQLLNGDTKYSSEALKSPLFMEISKRWRGHLTGV